MLALIVGVLLGAALATPLVPLLRVTDVTVGRAAAGIGVIAVAVFAVQFWAVMDGREGFPLKGVSALAAQVVVSVWPIYAVAALVAVLGTLGRQRV